MPVEIVRNDITRMRVDAIVNAASSSLLGGGGVDGAIHRAAGARLLAACRRLGGCRTGEAKITRGFGLPCKYVIHTVGPVWVDGAHGEEALLRACYLNALRLAQARRCRSIAFPLISTGAFGYPRDRALRVAMDTIRDFLLAHTGDEDMLVYIVVFDRESFALSEKLYAGIAQYIDDHYALARLERERGRNVPPQARPDADAPLMAREEASMEDEASAPFEFWESCESASPRAAEDEMAAPGGAVSPFETANPRSNGAQVSFGSAQPRRRVMPCAQRASAPDGLGGRGGIEAALEMIDESFSAMVLRKIDEKGMTDPQCYKRANLDRKLFSKLRKDSHYRPKKQTALALAVALELPLEETRELLMKAGYALSRSDKGDIIVEYFIVNRCYDIFEINAALYSFDQIPLGGRA